jgi:Fe-S oxidoreductase
MARLKAEVMHARHEQSGVPLSDRIIARSDLLGRVGTVLPGLANSMLGNGLARRMMQAALGFHREAPIPLFAGQRFDTWFHRRTGSRPGVRGMVILWDDTWARYHEPGVGKAAVEVLEAAGFEVTLAEGRKCCGRPAASRGLLRQVRRSAEHNIRLLAGSTEPIIFLEPSCWSMFVDEYLHLGIDGADGVAERAVLFEDFVYALLEHDPEALLFASQTPAAAVHGHCHAKALSDARRVLRVLERLPGADPRWLETGCCGMAGAFGMVDDHRELSHLVAEPLVRGVDALPSDTMVVASGTSCRHQIGDLTERQPMHIAEFLASCLQKPS